MFILVLLLSGCKDYFQLERPPQNPWTTVSEFERAPIGAYTSLFSGDKWNMPWVNWALVKTSMGDDVDWVSNGEWGYWRKTKEFNIYTDKNILLLYRSIAVANLALRFAQTNESNPFPAENDEKSKQNLQRINGELHFVRAYAYYYLQTTFGHAYVPGGVNSNRDIPIPTQYASSLDEAKKPKIGTTQQVYDLIVEDLQTAKQLLPESYLPGIHHPSYQVRANRFAASAMLMRTYFQRGEYEKALGECNYLIDQNQGAYDLSEDPIAAFSKSDATRAREVIFYVPYYDNTLSTPHHLSVMTSTYERQQCNWSETRMAAGTIKRLGWMENPQTDTAFTIAAKRDKRFQQLMSVRYPQNRRRDDQAFDKRTEIANLTTLWPNKFFRGTGYFNSNVPLIRLAEVYLTRSILRFKAGDRTGAAADLNLVRQRAWDTSVGGVYQPITPQSLTEEMIHNERVIEMFNESDRIDYLRGLKMPIPKGERGQGTDPYTSEDFIWMIPVRETLYNENF
jgi:tetratricopeptide (TPR) repeat protein